MTTATIPPIRLPLRPEPPCRSPRTSFILAELARQRRWERRQRREARARRAAWLALFNRAPFDSMRTHATPGVSFAGTTPLIYALTTDLHCSAWES
jgi:hypothetical protein